MTVQPPARLFSYDDYAAIGDGRRYQVLDGELVLTPSPFRRHQRLLGRLFRWASDHVDETGAGEVFIAPFDVVLAAASPATVLQPDLLFVAKGRPGVSTKANVQGPPDLVVEILSRSTARLDRVRKLALYARFGVPEVWFLPYDDARIDVLRLAGETYGEPQAFRAGDAFASLALPGLAIDVGALFAGVDADEVG